MTNTMYDGVRVLKTESESKDPGDIGYETKEHTTRCYFDLKTVFFVAEYPPNAVDGFTSGKRTDFNDVLDVYTHIGGVKHSFFILEDYDTFISLLEAAKRGEQDANT